METDNEIILCSDCFQNEGLRLDAQNIATVSAIPCPSCGSAMGCKLTREMVFALTYRFFVWGTLLRTQYGAAPVIQFNDKQATDVDPLDWLDSDMKLIERKLGVGFFYYGPRLWMVGEFPALKMLLETQTRATAIDRILTEYPSKALNVGDSFYRIRKAPRDPSSLQEYDSPPASMAGSGRLDSENFPVMYASPDLQVCVHECRVAAEDDLYVATLASRKTLKLLDLSVLLWEDNVTEFESLDLAVHMIFLAGPHAYSITRAIALAAHKAGFKGIIYPSYFSLLRTGAMPFETIFGISNRHFRELIESESAKTIPNYGLFGRPIENQSVEFKSINRLVISRAEYNFHFGPVGFAPP